ncbi:hypothetical protein BJ742DRAFT_845277 [Cladochytrium replicatum]|nr:hypothetical protein BJ742DRAFT_845277 [Cladochytrium replicatum]
MGTLVLLIGGSRLVSRGLELRLPASPLIMASKGGHTEAIKGWKSSGLIKTVREESIHIHPTRWKESRFTLRWWQWAVDGGRAFTSHILTRWRLSGLLMHYEHATSEFGNVAVFEWRRSSGLELKDIELSMDAPSTEGRVDVLEWVKRSKLELKKIGDGHR